MEDEVHVPINIIESNYSQFKRSNLTSFAKDVQPELQYKLYIELTAEQYYVRQIQSKVAYFKKRYAFISEEFNQTGSELETGDQSRCLIEFITRIFTYFSRMLEFDNLYRPVQWDS